MQEFFMIISSIISSIDSVIVWGPGVFAGRLCEAFLIQSRVSLTK